MDAFSEVLSGVRLKGAMFFSAEFSAPWRLSTPHCRALAPTLAPGAPHMRDLSLRRGWLGAGLSGRRA